jgi:hypothetical protein
MSFHMILGSVCLLNNLLNPIKIKSILSAFQCMSLAAELTIRRLSPYEVHFIGR